MSDYQATIGKNASATILCTGDYGRATIGCRRLFAGDYRLLSDYGQRLSGDYPATITRTRAWLPWRGCARLAFLALAGSPAGAGFLSWQNGRHSTNTPETAQNGLQARFLRAGGESIREKVKRNTEHFSGIYGGFLISAPCCAVQCRVKPLFLCCEAFSAGGNAGVQAKRKAAWSDPDGSCDYLFFRAQ